MSDDLLEIRITAAGIEEALRALDARQVYTALMIWFSKGSQYIRDELRSRAPKTLRGKVYIRLDTARPPRWARISVRSPLARLIEGGTGLLGDPRFKHTGRHWPPAAGIQRSFVAMGRDISLRQAFLVARTIGIRGGNRPRPFIAPTRAAVTPRVIAMAHEAVREALKQ